MATLLGRHLLRLTGFAVRVVALVVVVGIVVGTLSAGILTVRGWPPIDGTLQVPGLHASASVRRDTAGIIQITANDPHDLFLAQGYVHAQERMWQMEISRRIGAGRLSELFGKSQIETDRFIRTLGWRQAATRDLAAMAPDVRAAMAAYSDGVNAWIDQHQGSLSLPFVVAGLLGAGGGLGGIHLDPWTPLDTATWQKVQAWSLGGNEDVEIFRMLADARLGDPALTDELFPSYDPAAPIITPGDLLPDSARAAGDAAAAAGATNARVGGDAAGVGGTTPAVAAEAWTALAQAGDGIASLAGFDGGSGLVGDHGVGSNDWVVAGSRAASGKPLLANDPHLGFSMPSVWIMNGLHCQTVSAACPWDVVGVSFPGAPAVILGHNASIAWGATNVGPDTQDLYRETVDPRDPTHYLVGTRSNPFLIRHEVIHVAGGPDVEFDVRSTVHGPILNDASKALASEPPMALEWTTTKEVDRTFEAFFRIDLATTFEEFKAAFDVYGSPSQNFVYADIHGHIGYVLPGLIPIRGSCPQNGLCASARPGAPSLAALGERPQDGSSGADWQGYIPRDKLPWQLDPPSGLIVTANNKPADGSYPFALGHDGEWDPGYRAAQITTLLKAHTAPLTAADLSAIQTNTHVLRADTIVPELRALHPAPPTPDGQVVWQRIESWDGDCAVDSTGCAAYLTWELEVQRLLFDQTLGPIARDYVGSPPSWQALRALLARPTDPWWRANLGELEAKQPGDAGGVVSQALTAAGTELRTAYGDPAGWTWGHLHTVAFKESTLGDSGIAPLAWYFDAPARPVAGADGAIDNTYYQFSTLYRDPYDPTSTAGSFGDAFDVTNGPSYRLAIDMADLDGARIVITTGQSGNPFDRHYGDLVDTWIAGATVPLPFSPEAISGATVATVTLDP